MLLVLALEFAPELALERFVMVLLLLLPPSLLPPLLPLLLPMGARAAALINVAGLFGGIGPLVVPLALFDRSGFLVAILKSGSGLARFTGPSGSPEEFHRSGRLFLERGPLSGFSTGTVLLCTVLWIDQIIVLVWLNIVSM